MWKECWIGPYLVALSPLVTVQISVVPRRIRWSTRSASNGRPLTRPTGVPFRSKESVSSRCTVAGGSSGSGRSAPGSLLRSRSLRSTVKRSTGSIRSSPVNWPWLVSIALLPTASPEKSTTRSIRSPAASGKSVPVRSTGAGSRPPSEPIWWTGREPKLSFRNRRVELFSTRRRYLRAATGNHGFERPLTRMTFRAAGSPCTSPPFGSNCASRMAIGTSYSPLGRRWRLSSSPSMR